ncbi:MAG: vacuolar iron transporter family protein [Thermoplasmata archaeon]|jgi:VIT1/CCC1 family predicted Fe2+/Mn2+ transporter|nr:vacuolar iron transporter family protein [Thermoplasmata archaeon]
MDAAGLTFCAGGGTDGQGKEPGDGWPGVQAAPDGKTLADLQAEHKPPPVGHIADEEHEQPAFRNYVRDLILGFNDGVVSVYAICAGLAGAAFSAHAIAVGGIAALAAGALSMGIGEYISTKSQAQYYGSEARREREHIKAYRGLELQELRQMLREKGYPAELVEPLAKHIAEDDDRFVDFMMREEFGVGKESGRSPVSAMLLVMAAFVAGAALPVLSFILAPTQQALALATALSVGGLFAAGAAKGWVSGLPALRSGLEMAVLGSLAAAATYGIGNLVGINV